ncbi:hypothetical protein BG011_009424 [Mortierella polycephala]|uniref:Uncharacterized protein n=1 Tax=Mortierella polycephala TaxID=41804 RepID=A0A9P6QAJ6_9FUNG|nr:hypothetical protein BG011_009424 [Mortierella polycephala]
MATGFRRTNCRTAAQAQQHNRGRAANALTNTGATVETADITHCSMDTLAAVHYLVGLLHPRHVKQQKVFPRVCLVHQIYSIVKDHTTVDRTLDQLIKDGTLRKFYLGGTGSDEFAIMLTEDYVEQIQQAKEQFLQDQKDALQQEQQQHQTAKRKAVPFNGSVSSKKIALGSASTEKNSVAMSVNHGTPLTNQGQKCEIFDRFRDLVTGGHCIEISIQHSNIQSVIGATDQDITTLIRYSLLNRSLSAPANPHLVNLEQSPGRVSNSSNNDKSSNAGAKSSHPTLHQLISIASQEQAKTVKPDAAAASSSSCTAPLPNPMPTTVISAASGRRERVSDDVAYRFSIRHGGLFVTHFLKGRLEILRMIKRQMFGDMLTS